VRKLITLHRGAAILLCCGSLMGLISGAGRYPTISREETEIVMGGRKGGVAEKGIRKGEEGREND